jgi:hypothetical protein
MLLVVLIVSFFAHCLSKSDTVRKKNQARNLFPVVSLSRELALRISQRRAAKFAKANAREMLPPASRVNPLAE